MITDAFNTFTKAFSNIATGGNGTYFDDAIDLVDSRNIGQGHPVYAVVTVTAAMVGASSTISLSIVQDSVSTGSASQEVFLGSAFLAAQLPAGSTVAFPLLPILGTEISGKRYIRAKIVTSGATLTSATLTVTLVPHVADGKIEYPSGFVS